MRPILSLALLVPVMCGASLAAQAQNPVYRANRAFYTSMWTANPPEYTTAGQSVAAGTMHWRAFLDQTNQRREARQINGIGTWWQPSDLTGTFPQTIFTPEFRIYPTTVDAAGLVIPDVTSPPVYSLPPIPLPVTTGNAFNSISLAFGQAVPIAITDFAICGVYPQAASSTAPGFFGFLPSAANEALTLRQSYYGFAYPGGPITHFGLGGARSSIWYTEEQPTLNLRANWAVSDAHNQANHTTTAFGDQAYFAPISNPAWPGWSDSRATTAVGLSVFAQGRDGDLPLVLFNFGPRFFGGLPFFGQVFELDLASPVLGVFVQIMPSIFNGRADVDIPIVNSPRMSLAGQYLGFEALLLDQFTFQFSGTTPSAWVRL